MNFYGETNGPEHQLFGRLAPICEALHRAVLRRAGKSLQRPVLSHATPEWCDRIADKLVLTIFKRLADLSPQEKFDARNYGRIVGFMIRGIIHLCQEVPAQFKREGLSDLSPEKEKKLEAMFDTPAILAFASNKFGRVIANEDELIKAGTEELQKTVDHQVTALLLVGRYLLNRPIAEQHEFLCGIPDGFSLFLKNDGSYTGERPRTELYLLLLMYWSEIVEMQKADPPKTCKFLLDWLEKQEGKQLVNDEKQFNGLCCEIGLVMAPPGHPHKSPPA